MGSMDACTPRASLESESPESFSRGTSSATRTLNDTSSTLLSKGAVQLEREAQGNASGLTCTSLSSKQKLCMSMLAGGKPKASIEFFNATHSRAPEERLHDKGNEEKGLPLDLLAELSANLVETELARRIGDAKKLAHFNFSIGKIFEKFGDHKKAVWYYLKSMMNSKEAEDLDQEAEVKFSLGIVYVKLGDCANAIASFEEYVQFARERQKSDSIRLGSRQLLEVYQMSAEMAHKAGDLEKSLLLYQKSLNMAETCEDGRAKAEAKHEMGLLYETNSRIDLALQYQLDYLDFCQIENDPVGQSKARVALAKAEEMLGNTEIALQHLEALLQVSQFVNLKTQAIACCKLGMMYSSQQLYDKALAYFEMFFKMACMLKDPKLVDSARVNIGFVRNALATSNIPCSINISTYV